ncbi:catalase family protein [Streptomyces sp. NPDC005727]|uniref:catalase family protein n=1 Tax=Streptomyces sp. NPDC005727 TaxID=3157053 RepID=UPI0033DE9EF2
MSQEFVKYSPDVELVDPDFEENLEAVIENMKKHIKRSVEVEGIQRAVRDAHAKGYGLARAEVEILKGAPEPYAQGIYGKPGRHEAMVRFSQGTSHTGADRFLGSTVGIGLKMFGIDGKTLLEDEPNSDTFDYAMINYPTFFVNDIEHYVFLDPLFESTGTVPPPNESPEQRRAKMYRFLHDWVTGKGTLPPEEWAWKELRAFLELGQIKYINLLLSTYYTMGAVRHGDYIAKVRVAPVQEFADRVVQRTLDPNAQEQVFRPALVAELRERPYEFDIQVQLCTDLDHMPVEDTTVCWSETLSPFVTVAKLRLPRQDIGGDDNLERMDATSMTPWRVTEKHRPLGNIMRARKEVYRQSSILRHQLNHQVRKEPSNLAEVFGN